MFISVRHVFHIPRPSRPHQPNIWQRVHHDASHYGISPIFLLGLLHCVILKYSSSIVLNVAYTLSE